MALLGQINDRLALMSETMSRTAATDHPSNLNFDREYRRVVTNCLFCRRGKECQDFLEETRGTDDIPSFCPNIANFGRMEQA
ncbi:MAG: DUF6455 family protein [Pseudomonadota bacterium]